MLKSHIRYTVQCGIILVYVLIPWYSGSPWRYYSCQEQRSRSQLYARPSGITEHVLLYKTQWFEGRTTCYLFDAHTSISIFSTRVYFYFLYILLWTKNKNRILIYIKKSQICRRETLNTRWRVKSKEILYYLPVLWKYGLLLLSNWTFKLLIPLPRINGRGKKPRRLIFGKHVKKPFAKLVVPVTRKCCQDQNKTWKIILNKQYWDVLC